MSPPVQPPALVVGGHSFNPTTLSKIAKASPSAVAAGFASLRPQLQNGKWLASQNRYRVDVVDKIASAGSGIRKHKSLTKYVAASAPLHAADAARSLGRALYCLAINDVHSSRHFAYYAELRAAMSILACAGIGVFSRKHVVIRSTELDLIAQPIPTHPFTWLAFSHWTATDHAFAIIGRRLKPGSQPLDAFVAGICPGKSIKPYASSWFRDWGLDLKYLSEDQIRRNESSYRPSTLKNVAALDVDSIRNFLLNFWKTFYPATGSRFEVLDAQLLRLALEDMLARKNLGVNAADIVTMFGNMGIAITAHHQVQSVLRRDPGVDVDSAIFQYAHVTPRYFDPTLHFSMISRAAMLLRIAIGSVADLVEQSGLSRTEYSFWINEYGIASGIMSAMPDDCLDLWTDVELALQDVSAFGAGANQYDWSQAQSKSLVTLSEFERVVTWGLAS